MDSGEGKSKVGVLLDLMHEVKEGEAVFTAGESNGEVVMRFKHIIVIDGLFDFGELGLVVFHNELLRMGFSLILIIA